MGAPAITAHSVERWQQRVDPDASWLSAHLAIRRFLRQARVRPTPRHWQRRPSTPGTTYAYCARQPGICIILAKGKAVTVITRDSGRTAPPLSLAKTTRRPKSSPPPIPVYLDDLAA